MIKGHTGKIKQIESASDDRFVVSLGEDEAFINIWDLESEKKAILTPIARIETTSPSTQIKVNSQSKSSIIFLLAVCNEKIQFYKITIKQKGPEITKGIIRDKGESILSCNFVKKTTAIVCIIYNLFNRFHLIYLILVDLKFPKYWTKKGNSLKLTLIARNKKKRKGKIKDPTFQ